MSNMQRKSQFLIYQSPDATVKSFLTDRQEGKRQVSRNLSRSWLGNAEGVGE